MRATDELGICSIGRRGQRQRQRQYQSEADGTLAPHVAAQCKTKQRGQNSPRQHKRKNSESVQQCALCMAQEEPFTSVVMQCIMPCL